MPPSPGPNAPVLAWALPTAHLDAYVALELQASEPYVNFVYGGLDAARPLHRRLVDARVGEFAEPFGKLGLDAEGEPVGMFAGPLGVKDLARARMAAAMALRTEAGFAEGGAYRGPASAARAALLTLEEGDGYLSRIAV